jgi:hypothetical protein
LTHVLPIELAFFIVGIEFVHSNRPARYGSMTQQKNNFKICFTTAARTTCESENFCDAESPKFVGSLFDDSQNLQVPKVFGTAAFVTSSVPLLDAFINVHFSLNADCTPDGEIDVEEEKPNLEEIQNSQNSQAAVVQRKARVATIAHGVWV